MIHLILMPMSHTKYKLHIELLHQGEPGSYLKKEREKHDSLTLPRTPEQAQASIHPTNPITYKSTLAMPLYLCYEPPS